MLKYTRWNGKFFLEVVGHPDYGVPFGQDRLVLIWIATQAIRRQSPVMEFESAAQILWEFGMDCLDLYTWLTWQCHNAKGSEGVPLFGLLSLASQLGVQEYARETKFRERVKIWLELVSLYWPKCPAKLAKNGAFLDLDRAFSRPISSSCRPSATFLRPDGL